MTTERLRIEVSGIAVEVLRKQIKNLHVGVYPPNGRVRVAAPLSMGEDAVRLAIVSRLGWIRRQQAAFEQQDRQSMRELVSGESHYFQGRRYLLDVVVQSARPRVCLAGNKTMELHVRPGDDRSRRDALLQRWYRRQLREQLAPLLARWEPKVGEAVAELRIKKMKTKWGSCNAEDKRVWLNLELVKKPVSCLEYILVHEMVHFLERQHTDRFQKLMDGLLPTWRLSRDELNCAPLAHEGWAY